ncbi:MAG: hypothetical protein DRP09_08930 [Candidatus Thorarchaeota archaeon]|nr:MAG: hypothetical protein DRP09_08930 [Candidatus Thorarchaeota archaeon]
MRRSPARLLLLGFVLTFALLMVGSGPVAQAQVFPDDFVHDDRLYVYFALDGQNVKGAGSIATPIEINMEAPMDLLLQINVTGTQHINMSGQILFYYQGMPLFPIRIVEPVSNSTWILVDPSVPIPPIAASIDFSSVFSYNGIKLVTGVFEASVDFQYYIEGDPTLHIVSEGFYFSIPSTAADVFTSVGGISASVATIGAVYGMGTGFQSLFEGVKTAYKLRGIHKKASEIRSLPNMTVLGALPLLFSMLAGMGKIKKKKTTEEGKDGSGVSEYIVRQKLREIGPDAWPGDKCPKCKRDWHKKTNTCKKCKIGEDEARLAYAELLASKVPKALAFLGKKKSTDIRTLAKKTKSTDYNAGVIAAAMVDTGVTEIVKVGTPLRSFVMNIAGLAFLVVTWQQLLGDSASTWQTSITIVGAVLSLALIIALYFSRKSQIEKFNAEIVSTKSEAPAEEPAPIGEAEPTEPEEEAVSEAAEPETPEEQEAEVQEPEVSEETVEEVDSGDGDGEPETEPEEMADSEAPADVETSKDSVEEAEEPGEPDVASDEESDSGADDASESDGQED